MGAEKSASIFLHKIGMDMKNKILEDMEELYYGREK